MPPPRPLPRERRHRLRSARVNLIGEHTDYSGGLVLPVAIDLGTTVAWQPLDGLVRVRSLAFGDVVEIGTDGGGAVAGWGRYVAAVVALLHERGRPDAGIDAVVSSTVPIGSGLSSSAALTVSLALALCGAASFELDPLQLARLMQEAERSAVGVPCGLMDPACVLLGYAERRSEVERPELDLLVDLDYEHGARAVHTIAAIVAAYRERTGREGRFSVCESVDGAAIRP